MSNIKLPLKRKESQPKKKISDRRNFALQYYKYTYLETFEIITTTIIIIIITTTI
jgi:hypothetical protein